MCAGVVDGGFDRTLRIGPGQHGIAKGHECLGVTFVLRRRLVILEAARQLIGVIEDVLDCAWHVHHLRNLSRALIACTTTGVGTPSTTPIS